MIKKSQIDAVFIGKDGKIGNLVSGMKWYRVGFLKEARSGLQSNDSHMKDRRKNHNRNNLSSCNPKMMRFSHFLGRFKVLGVADYMLGLPSVFARPEPMNFSNFL